MVYRRLAKVGVQNPFFRRKTIRVVQGLLLSTGYPVTVKPAKAGNLTTKFGESFPEYPLVITVFKKVKSFKYFC